jgi:acetyl esterase/lipase
MSNRCGQRRKVGEVADRSFIAPPKTGPSSWIADDGVVYVRELALRPSDLWSSDFARFYMKRMAETAAPLPFPKRAAPRAEWDRFDAWVDAEFNAEPLAKALKLYPVEVVDRRIAGVRASTITPRDGLTPENERRVLINLHGGGFVMNRGLVFGKLESVPVAAIGGFRIITLDYRQAPYATYPAASEDVEAVYRHLLKSYAPGAIGIFGCSAGGMLTAQAVAWFRAKGLPRPGAVGILSFAPPPPYSPAAWGGGWGESAMWFAGLPQTECSVQSDDATRWYMESADVADAVAFPGIADDTLRQFPPTLYLSGSRDFSMSSTVVAHARFVRLGVDASLYIMEGAPHGAHVLAVGTPEAHDAQAYIARWFARHLASA